MDFSITTIYLVYSWLFPFLLFGISCNWPRTTWKFYMEFLFFVLRKTIPPKISVTSIIQLILLRHIFTMWTRCFSFRYKNTQQATFCCGHDSCLCTRQRMGTWWVRLAAKLVLRGRPTSFKRSMKRHPRVVSVTGNSPSLWNCIRWRLRADAKCLVIKPKRWRHTRLPVFSLTTGTIYMSL